MKSSFHILQVKYFLPTFFNILIFVFFAEFFTFIYFENYFGSFYFFIGFFFVLSLKLFVKIKESDYHTMSLFLLVFSIAFLSFPILAFFRNSISTILWIYLIPLGVPIFYSAKTSLKIFFLVTLISILLVIIHFSVSFMGSNNLSYNHKLYGDYVSFFNIALIAIYLIYFNIKIRKDYKKYLINQRTLILEKIKTDTDNIRKEKLMVLKKYILTNLLYKKYNYSIGELSLAIGKSNYEINRTLKINNLKNFKQFLNQIRVEKIIEIMNSEEIKQKTLKAIFTENGFENQSTFNKVFKEFSGLTPSEFIKKIEK